MNKSAASKGSAFKVPWQYYG